jgi:hypothetical protein
MAMTGAERQARWREKRDLLARQASTPGGLLPQMEALTPEALEAMGAVMLEHLQRECSRVHRMALEARKRIATKRHVTKT